jgi:phosphoribosylformylglycinamidine (FGAM) synthase PurS component
VVFPAQWCGIEQAGTAYRMDSVAISLKKVVDAPKGVPTDEEILRRILKEVKDIKAKKTIKKDDAESQKTVVLKNKISKNLKEEM